MKKLFFLLTILCSCGNHQSAKVGSIDLLSSASGEISRLTDIATEIEYIPLETSGNSLIRHIYDLKVTSNKIFINTITDILCFDFKGRFLYKLDNVGRGPGEYTYINDFDINSTSSLLMILGSKKILFYNVTKEGFVFNKSLSLNNQPNHANFLPNQNHILLSYGSASGIEPFQNLIINLNGDMVNFKSNSYMFNKALNKRFSMTFDNIFFKNDDLSCFKGMMSDTIFSIDQDDIIKPYFILNTRGTQISTEILANYSVERMQDILNIYEIMEVSRYLLYKFAYKKNRYFEIYDKVNKRKFGLNTTDFIKENIMGGPNIEPKFSNNGKLYTWIDALTFKKYISSDAFKSARLTFPEKKNVLEELANSLNETDNPVLIILTPKK
jgi:hypothetical protein